MKLVTVTEVERVGESPFAPDGCVAYMGLDFATSDETRVIHLVEFYIPEDFTRAFDIIVSSDSIVDLEYLPELSRHVHVPTIPTDLLILVPEIIGVRS